MAWGTFHRAGQIACAVALAGAAPARADVMEVGEGSATWIAGGPSAPGPVTGHATGSANGPATWRPLIAALSRRYDLSPAMIEALVSQESGWHSRALSPRGARGLAQLMPATARALGADPDDPAQNLAAGARYLHALVDHFHGDLEAALAAYNAGPARVEAAGGVPHIAQTRHYVAAIMARLAARSRDGR
jgi:soluble lytic murein transglycosylase-like protein